MSVLLLKVMYWFGDWDCFFFPDSDRSRDQKRGGLYFRMQLSTCSRHACLVFAAMELDICEFKAWISGELGELFSYYPISYFPISRVIRDAWLVISPMSSWNVKLGC